MSTESLLPANNYEDSLYNRKVQGRSSLDTFIIPNRTRLPSSKPKVPDEIDIHLAKTLLDIDKMEKPVEAGPRSSGQHVVVPVAKNSPVLNASLIHQQGRTSPVLSAALIHQQGRTSPVLSAALIHQQGRTSSILNTSSIHQRGRTSSILNASSIHQRGRLSPVPNASLIHQRGRTSPVLNASSIHQQGRTSPVLNSSFIHQRGSSGSYSWLPTGYDGPIDSTDQSRGTSTTWSTVSDRLFTDTSSGSDHRETSEFVKEYNNLAAKYKLPLFVAQPKNESRVSSAQSAKSSAKSSAQSSIVVATKPHWLLRKILRKSSSSYSVKTKAKAPKPVCKSVSIADLRKIGRVDLLKDKSLEELARLGGVSLLMLPTDFAAAQLAVPVGIGATAAYILQHGRNIPGIFRISGQLSTVNKLYDHYAQQIDAADKEPAAIRQTVTAALIPSHISHNIHDVAAVFKKFLNALPGGILGSLSLFTALESIHKEFYTKPDATETDRREARARLIALAISSITSQYRVSLICAVLGLVAVIGHETQTALTNNGTNFNSDSAPTAELMSYKGLGLVFAPLVIGDLTDDIELEPKGDRDGVLSLPDSPPKRRKENKRKTSMPKFPGMPTFLDMSGARYKIVANVFEMLLINWKDVVAQLRSFGAMRGQSTSPVKRRQLAAVPRAPSSANLTIADQVSLASATDGEVARLIDEAEKIAASRHPSAASSAPGAPPATTVAVETSSAAAPPRRRQPSATHTRKVSAPAIAAGHGFAIFLAAGAPPPTTTRAPSSPRALRAGSVKQLVRHISRTSCEPSGSSSSASEPETRPRREALMAGLARQGSVKEAAQRLAAAASGAPCPPAPRPTAPKGSMIPKPVAAASRPSLPSAPSLGEQLAEARREAAMWRERAEWAERRLGFRMGVGGGLVPT